MHKHITLNSCSCCGNIGSEPLSRTRCLIRCHAPPIKLVTAFPLQVCFLKGFVWYVYENKFSSLVLFFLLISALLIVLALQLWHWYPWTYLDPDKDEIGLVYQNEVSLSCLLSNLTIPSLFHVFVCRHGSRGMATSHLQTPECQCCVLPESCSLLSLPCSAATASMSQGLWTATL